MSFENQIDWILKNKDHALIKALADASKRNQGDLRNGIQLSLGIVVEYLSNLPKT